jgi:hypothetical protein
LAKDCGICCYALSGLIDLCWIVPRALPWAILLSAFGAENQAVRSPTKLSASKPCHALKAQHMTAQGNALGIPAPGKIKPCRGGTKSMFIHAIMFRITIVSPGS